MATKIGKTAAVLTANSSGFTTAYREAEAGLKSFATTAASVASGMAAFDIGKAAAEGAYNWTVGLVRESLKSIDNLNDQATALGVSTEALSRLSYAAAFSGVSTEALNTGLRKMLDNLGNAKAGSDTAAAAFTDLGIDLASFGNLTPDEQLGVLADKLAGIEDPARRMSLAMNVLGKGAADMMPLLMGGSQALADLAAESDNTGNTVSSLGAAKVAAANDALDRLSKLATGVGQSLAIELAPYITAAADALFGMATSGDSVGTIVVNAMEKVTQGVAIASDYARLLQVGWNVAQAGIGLAIAALLDDIDAIGKATVALLNLLPGVNLTWTDTIGAMSAALKEGANEDMAEARQAYDDFASGATSKKVGQFFQNIRDGADEAAKGALNAKAAVTTLPDAVDKASAKVEENLAKLRREVEQFGMSKGDKLGSDLAAQGATPAQVAEAKALQAKLDALEAEKKAQEDATAAAKKYYDETRSPQEKYVAELERINELVAKGKLDSETAQRAADKARAEMEKATKEKDTKDTPALDAPKLLQAGSAAAANFVAQVQRQQRGDDPAAQMVKRQDKANTYLADIRDAAVRTAAGADWQGV